jgi:hypothetical protein
VAVVVANVSPASRLPKPLKIPLQRLPALRQVRSQQVPQLPTLKNQLLMVQPRSSKLRAAMTQRQQPAALNQKVKHPATLTHVFRNASRAS